MTSAQAIYASSPDALSDDVFVPGDLGYLAVGNRGRMLDPRRTPVEVTEVSPGKVCSSCGSARSRTQRTSRAGWEALCVIGW